jgi:serine/threonine-protein kinase
MGEVWSGRDLVLGRPVAVKLVRAGRDRAADRFGLEVRTAARLNHPHVVTVFDAGTTDDRLFLVMELLSGRTVSDERNEHGGRLDPYRVATIGAQAAAGLAAAHRHGVVHRDVKPANLMLAADDRVKVGDFGVARFTSEVAEALTGTGQVVGTSLYLAPERVRGDSAAPASDVYALGCVLYELLAGHPAVRGETPLAVLHQHLTAEPEPLELTDPDLGGPLAALIMAMLAKDPDLRPSARAVTEVLTGLTNTAVDPTEEPTVPAAAAAGAAGARPGGRRAAVRAAAVQLAGRRGAVRAAAGPTVRVATGRPVSRWTSRRSRAVAGTTAALAVTAAAIAISLPASSPAPSHGSTPASHRPSPTGTLGQVPVSDQHANGATPTGHRPSGSASASAAGTPSTAPTTASPAPAPTTAAPTPTAGSPSPAGPTASVTGPAATDTATPNNPPTDVDSH